MYIPTLLKQLRTLVAGACLAAVPGVFAADPVENLPSPYITSGSMQWISWDAPTIACAGVPINYKMTGYDWFNRALSWSIVSGPAGMTIDNEGYISWTPPTNGVNQVVTVRMTPEAGVPVEKTFTIQVNSAKCIFVATNGNDAGAGTFSAPFRTIAKAIDVAAANNGTGRLILVRGGTYNESWANAMNWWGRNFTMTNPLIVRNYPEESVNIKQTVRCLGNFSDYIVWYNLALEGGSESENGTLGVHDRQVAKLISASRFRAANANNNPTGFKTSGSAILDRCKSFDNYAPGQLSIQNHSNFLHFCDGTSGGREAFYIDCESAGQSVVGYKVKHSGPDRVHYHRCVTYGTPNGFDVQSNWSSIRFCLAVADGAFAIGNRAALNFGGSSGSKADLGVLFDGNMAIAKNGMNGLDLGYGGTESLDECPIARNNTLVALVAASISYPGLNFPVRRQSYGSVPPPSPRRLINNLIYSPSSAQVQLNATNASSILSISQANAQSGCSGNTHGGAAPSTLTFTAAGKRWTFTVATGVLSSSPLTAPSAAWQVVNIGTNGGTATFSGNTITVNGAGTGPFGTSDKFTYVCQPATGDCEITARVINSSTYGVMIRTDLTSGSPFKALYINASGGAFTTSRSGSGQSITAAAAGGGLSRPHYLRIVRSGNSFTVFRSPDGVNYTAAGTQILALPANAYIGIAQPQSTGSLYEIVSVAP